LRGLPIQRRDEKGKKKGATENKESTHIRGDVNNVVMPTGGKERKSSLERHVFKGAKRKKRGNS